jgi:hypothetical protein
MNSHWFPIFRYLNNYVRLLCGYLVGRYVVLLIICRYIFYVRKAGRYVGLPLCRYIIYVGKVGRYLLPT